MRDLTVRLEPWSDGLWAEMRPHAYEHFAEVDGGVEPNRPFKLDLKLMRALDEAGSLKVIIARKHGRLIGYFTWNIMPDVESEGLLIAQQGAWFVAFGQWGVAARMFDVSVAVLKACGVQCVYPHHRMQGRGAGIGRFFVRRGAKPTQITYSLWIGS